MSQHPKLRFDLLGSIFFKFLTSHKQCNVEEKSTQLNISSEEKSQKQKEVV